MEEKIKEVSSQDLMQLYSMVIGHIEYLETEKEKVLEVDKK